MLNELLHLDDALSTEEKLIRDTIRQFVTTTALPLLPQMGLIWNIL